MDRRWVAAGSVALVALLAVGAWRLGASGGGSDAAVDPPPTAAGTGGGPADPGEPGDSDPGEPGDAPAPGPPPTRLDGTGGPGEPGSTSPPAGAGEVAPPTPPPAVAPTGAEPLVGTVRRSDPEGDLVDSAGLPPPRPNPAADLTGVSLTGDGEQLEVVFTLAGDVPAAAGSLVWSLDVWLGDDLAYTVTVQKVGARLVAGVLDWQAGEQVAPPEPPVADGTEVTVVVPRALLDRVDGPFLWQALAQADGGYEDHVPADGLLDWFPGGSG